MSRLALFLKNGINNFKANIKKPEILFWMFTTIFFVIIFYTFFFTYKKGSLLIDIITIDLTFMIFNVVLAMSINRRRTATTLLIFFTITKLISVVFGVFAHDVGVLDDLPGDIAKAYLKIASWLVILSSMAVSCIYALYLLTSMLFVFGEFLVLERRAMSKILKFCFLFSIIACELIFYAAFYNYVIYYYLITSYQKLIYEVDPLISREILDAAFDLLKPLLAFLALPLLLLINLFNKTNIFYSRSVIMHAAAQHSILVNYLQLINKNDHLYFPWIMIGIIIIIWIVTFSIIIKTILYNVQHENHDRPLYYSFFNEKNHFHLLLQKMKQERQLKKQRANLGRT